MRRRALILQDEPELRGSLLAMMRASGIDVVAEVATGDDAIDVAATTHPDVMVLDVDLTGSRGLHLIPALLAVVPDCTMLILSSFDELRFAALEAGAAAVIGKSDMRELRRCLDRLGAEGPGDLTDQTGGP